MKRILILAITIFSLLPLSETQARGGGGAGWIIPGLAIGGMMGAAMANRPYRDRYYDRYDYDRYDRYGRPIAYDQYGRRVVVIEEDIDEPEIVYVKKAKKIDAPIVVPAEE
jgi:hypothetical protein